MNFVRIFLQKVGILRQPVVQNLVDARCLGKKVKSIKYLGKADVYCLDVPATNNFLANGIVVHNCLDSLRYAIYTHFFNNDGTSRSAKDIDDAYYEAMGMPNVSSPFFDPRTMSGF